MILAVHFWLDLRWRRPESNRVRSTAIHAEGTAESGRGLAIRQSAARQYVRVALSARFSRTYDAVRFASAIGVPHSLKGETIWCFVVLKPGASADRGLATTLRNVVADHLGRSFLPSKVVFVPELPKTRSAKIVRRAIRAAALAEDPGDLSSVENPDALEGIRSALET